MRFFILKRSYTPGSHGEKGLAQSILRGCKWTLIAVPVAILVGSIVALFLWSLDQVTILRFHHGWLLFLLPLAGLVIYWLYVIAGKDTNKGNDLIINEIHDPQHGVPRRMAPLVLVATLVTHLCGGSAGREGTAVQIGGSIASLVTRFFRLSKQDTRVILTTGIAAGFGSVFGTPVTGAVFALEVLTIGTISHQSMLPCLIASFLADFVCSAWGIHHTAYAITPLLPALPSLANIYTDSVVLVKIIGAGICFGLAGLAFIKFNHAIKTCCTSFIKPSWLIPIMGGIIIICLTYIVGTTEYLGLGVRAHTTGDTTIASCFTSGGAHSFSWLLKILFTAITLGMGFKGGEVTPLFFIGAALGNTLGMLTGIPVDLMAGLGFIAVFAAATNTPLACIIMGVELFGGHYLFYFAITCFSAYYTSGYASIYKAQRRTIAHTHQVQ